MKSKAIIFALATAVAMGAAAAQPQWRTQVDHCVAQGQFAQAEQIMRKLPSRERKAWAVQIDSIGQIMQRIRTDFSLTPEQGLAQIRKRYPQVTAQQVQRWKQARQLEVMSIDGSERWFRKAVRNLWLLAPEFATRQDSSLQREFEGFRSYYRRAMTTVPDSAGRRDWHHASITFTLDVKPDAVPAGETLRVWMPFPFANARQRNIKLESSNRPVTMSQGSKHHTVCMEAQAQAGKATHFEYTFSYDVAEWHIAQQDLLVMAQPYDTTSELYKRYTSSEGRHIVLSDSLRALARRIVGHETNPVLQAQLIYSYIGRNFPWAGAREYSTFSNIPEYVLLNRHGDCGQVALLYIALTRSIGIPSRWESGYMLNPDGVNYHDWCETHFEGVGWVPTDPSHGRSVVGTIMEPYYASGIDVYRMASNEGVGDALWPRKKFIRSETVDFQPGEVEWKGGNLYYDKWSSHFNLNSMQPINNHK